MPISFFSEPLPPTIDELLAERAQFTERYPSSNPSRWRVSRRPLSFTAKDNASPSFYRIYQFVVLDRHIQLRNELEYFCTVHPEWAVDKLPDPADEQEPSRYAALAALTHLLCDAFNRRIELGLPRDAPPIVEDWEELARRPKVLERVPAWVENVSPLPSVVHIPNADGVRVDADDPEVCEPFKKLNLLIRQPHIHCLNLSWTSFLRFLAMVASVKNECLVSLASIGKIN